MNGKDFIRLVNLSVLNEKPSVKNYSLIKNDSLTNSQSFCKFQSYKITLLRLIAKDSMPYYPCGF